MGRKVVLRIGLCDTMVSFKEYVYKAFIDVMYTSKNNSVDVTSDRQAVLSDCFNTEYVRNCFLGGEFRIPVIIGVEKDGKPMVVDMANRPVMAITGSEGTGNINEIDAILEQILAFSNTEKIRLYVMDTDDNFSTSIVACMRHVRYYTHDYKRIGSIITGEFIRYVSLPGECNDSDIHKIFVLNDAYKLMAIAENECHFNLFGDIMNKRSLCENMSKSDVHIIMTINSSDCAVDCTERSLGAMGCIIALNMLLVMIALEGTTNCLFIIMNMENIHIL